MSIYSTPLSRNKNMYKKILRFFFDLERKGMLHYYVTLHIGFHGIKNEISLPIIFIQGLIISLRACFIPFWNNMDRFGNCYTPIWVYLGSRERKYVFITILLILLLSHFETQYDRRTPPHRLLYDPLFLMICSFYLFIKYQHVYLLYILAQTVRCHISTKRNSE